MPESVATPAQPSDRLKPSRSAAPASARSAPRASTTKSDSGPEPTPPASSTKPSRKKPPAVAYMAARRSDEVRANEEIVDDSRWPIYDRNRDERFPPRAGTYGAKGGSEKGGSASGTRDGPPGRSSGIVPGLQYYGSTPKQHAAPKYIRPVFKAKARGGIREDPRSPSPPDQEGLPDEQRSRRFGRQEYHRYSRSRSPCSREPLRPRREERGAEGTPGTKSCTISSGQHPYVQRKSREEKLAIRDQCPRAPRAPRPSSQPRLVEESRSPPPVAVNPETSRVRVRSVPDGLQHFPRSILRSIIARSQCWTKRVPNHATVLSGIPWQRHVAKPCRSSTGRNASTRASATSWPAESAKSALG